MDAFVIEGKAPLHGEITPSGNKNAAFPLIAAALLTDDPVTLHNLPHIGDVRTMLKIVEDLGVEITRHNKHSVTLRAGTIRTTTPDPTRFGKMRGSLVLMGLTGPRGRGKTVPTRRRSDWTPPGRYPHNGLAGAWGKI